MKALYLTTAIALAGLFVTESHASELVYSCAAQACKNANTPTEQCVIDDTLRAEVTDFGDAFVVKYGKSQTMAFSPTLNIRNGNYDVGVDTDKTDDVFYYMKDKYRPAYIIINRSKNMAMIFAGCKPAGAESK